MLSNNGNGDLTLGTTYSGDWSQHHFTLLSIQTSRAIAVFYSIWG